MDRLKGVRTRGESSHHSDEVEVNGDRHNAELPLTPEADGYDFSACPPFKTNLRRISSIRLIDRSTVYGDIGL